MHEAQIIGTEHGKQPQGDGWFILNAAEIGWWKMDGYGSWCGFEAPDARSELLGIGVHVLGPGDKPGFYHAESGQEGFFVLEGECLAIVEGEERRMRRWDYLHCPPGTAHITLAAGEEPCAILMVGTRGPDRTIHYPVEPAAARYGASVEQPSDSPREVYAGRPPMAETRAPWPR